MSSSYQAVGDAGRAISFAEQSVNLRQKILDANPDDVRALDRLAWAQSMLAFYQAEAGLEGARKDLLQSDSLYRRLRSRTNLPNPSIASFAHVELLLGEWEKRQGQIGPGCAYLRESLGLYRQWKEFEGSSDIALRETAFREGASCEGR
jgi:hypothetical protein